MTDIDVRLITDAELPTWLRASNTGFLRPPEPTPDQIAGRQVVHQNTRGYGAFEHDKIVATYRSFPQELTAIGGNPVKANALCNVSVLPTHRRRGLLTRFIDLDLPAAKERGDVVSTLVAAEYRIYERFGYGPATSMAEWEIDATRTGLDPRWAAPECGGTIEMITQEDVRKVGPELHDRFRKGQPGAISRPPAHWDIVTGALRMYPDWKEPLCAVYRAPSGEIEGLVRYDVSDDWTGGGQAKNTATVRELTATTAAAQRALWHHLCSVDWVGKVRSGWRAPDDLLPRLLPDPRSASITRLADWLWVRLLDVQQALEARSYDHEGSLVLEVHDRLGLAGGRFELTAGPEGARCVRSTRSADLALDISDLASLWLGDESAARLAALGRVREERAGAVRTAGALLGSSSGRPWCPDLF